MDIEQANATAVERLMESRPILKSVRLARDVIPGMRDNLLLHAGPPIEWARMSGPLRGAIIGALIFEGLAKSEAEAIAMAERALGLVTGDSVSQVASQTLHNLAAVDHGLGVPIYRPLAGDDKAEIVRMARQIGTYNICCEPFEDCCPRFMPRSPAIFSNPAELSRAESALDMEGLITLGLEGAGARDFKFEAGVLSVRDVFPHRYQKLLARRREILAPPAPSSTAPAKS